MDAETLAQHIFRMYEDRELPEVVALLLKDRDKRIQSLEDALASVESILWMAERYAEGGSSRGVEMEDFNRVKSILEQVKVKS